MFGIGETELVIIIVFAFLLFGPERLPGMGRTVGRAIRQFRNAQDSFTKVVQAEVAPVSDAVSDPGSVARAAKATLTGEDLEAAAEAERQAKQERLEAETHKETFAERRARLAAEREAAAPQAAAPEAAAAAPEAPAVSEPQQPEAPAPAAEPSAPAPRATSASALYGLATPLASEVAAEAEAEPEPTPEPEAPAPEPAAPAPTSAAALYGLTPQTAAVPEAPAAPAVEPVASTAPAPEPEAPAAPEPEPTSAPTSAAALYGLAPVAAQPQTPTTGEEDGDAPQA